MMWLIFGGASLLQEKVIYRWLFGVLLLGIILSPSFISCYLILQVDFEN